MGGYHEVTDAFAEVTHLNLDVLEYFMLNHRPMIIIVYRYTLAGKISIENPDQSEWVPTYSCENPRCSSMKDTMPDIRSLVVVWDVIVVFDYIPKLCSLGCRMMFLGMIPVLR